jgi:hypothetical protein
VPQSARAAGGRQRRPENSVIAGCGNAVSLPCSGGRDGNFLVEIGSNPGQIVVFSPYIKNSRGHYDNGRM